MSDSFSAELWQGVAGVYDAILAHPFLTGLTDGSLPHDAFAFSVVPAASYLHGHAPGPGRAPPPPAPPRAPRTRPTPPRRTSPTPATCSPPSAAVPLPKGSAPSC